MGTLTLPSKLKVKNKGLSFDRVSRLYVPLIPAVDSQRSRVLGFNHRRKDKAASKLPQTKVKSL